MLRVHNLPLVVRLYQEVTKEHFRVGVDRLRDLSRRRHEDQGEADAREEANSRKVVSQEEVVY